MPSLIQVPAIVDWGLKKYGKYKDRRSLLYLLHCELTEIRDKKLIGKAYLTFKSPADIEEMEYLTKATSVYEPNVFIDNDSWVT